MEKQKRLGDLLVEQGIITEQQLSYALMIQKNTGQKLGEIIAFQGFLSENEMMRFLQIQMGVRFIDLNQKTIDPKLASTVSPAIAKKYTLVPVELENGKLVVAMEDPLDFIALEDLRRASKYKIVPVISFKESIKQAIMRLYGTEFAEKAIKEYSDKQIFAPSLPQETIDSSLDEISNAPIVRLLDSIIEQAVQMKASDIHIEPFEKEVRIRIRVDGILQNTFSIPKDLHAALVARVKIIGGMNIAEKRLPQDGRIEVSIADRQIDMRLAVMPTWHGEKTVLRILDRSSFLINKEELGFSPENLEKFRELLKNPHGILLVTGPTGSGKTTTLYTMLSELNKEAHNIITIEDPVEYMLKGVNQTQVNMKAGLSFAVGLRALLRQDPDIVMIGEIRDKETSEIAVRAAITGHLVLSTLHTNDAISTIVRLMDMGIDSYLLAASMVGVISQRLVRKICTGCKTAYVPSVFECDLFGMQYDKTTNFYKGTGCSLCNQSGYKGRIPVHEVLVIDKKHREMIARKAPLESIKEYSKQAGMVSLTDECIKLLHLGITTVDEALRVSYSAEN